MSDVLEEQVNEIANAVAKSESGVSVTVPEKVLLVRDVFNILKRIVRGRNVNITYDLNEPYASMGAVTIVGEEILVEDPAVFAHTAAAASNFEVYPKTDGTVQMNFTFHGLTRKVAELE